MKKLHSASVRHLLKTIVRSSMFSRLRWGKGSFFSMVILLIMFLISGCAKQAPDIPAVTEDQPLSVAKTQPLVEILSNYSGLNATTQWELQQVRAATARYQHIKNADKDGYVDIHVDMMNMGHHYMRMENVDGTFDIRHPEILVYNGNDEGGMDLVAAEYAIPLNLSTDAPEGFTGTADVWDHNDGFGLWLLHAWVWKYNPDGVFNPTNPLVMLK